MSFVTLRMIKKNLFLLLLTFLFTDCTKPEKKEPAVKKEVNELPHLAFKNLDGSTATTRDLPPATVLILFNTDCDHCQREAKSIYENLDSFKGYTLQFIASDPEQNILQFAREYQLENQPNIRFGRAEGSDVYMNFGSIPTPAIYVYSKERRFIKSFMGETPVEQIIMSL
jgi:thiol-disulfide isomerase/thioredoxin